MKSYTKILILALVAVLSITALNLDAKPPKNTIKPDALIYTKGQDIVVKFTAQRGLNTNAWIGIIPSNVKHGSEAENDKYDVSYQYLGGKTTGTLIFKAPNKAGRYDLRLNSTDDNGVELATVTFAVK